MRSHTCPSAPGPTTWAVAPSSGFRNLVRPPTSGPAGRQFQSNTRDTSTKARTTGDGSALSRRSQTASTPKGGFPFRPLFRAVLERDRYGGAADLAIYCYPSLDAEALQMCAAGKDWRNASTGFSAACRIIRTSGTSSLSSLYGDVQILAIDQDDSIVLPERLRNQSRPRKRCCRNRFCWAWREIPALGARTVRRPTPARPDKVDTGGIAGCSAAVVVVKAGTAP